MKIAGRIILPGYFTKEVWKNFGTKDLHKL